MENISYEALHRRIPPPADNSMSSLILWNISKAVEENPFINLRTAMKSAQSKVESLENSSSKVNQFVTQASEERHLACALLAWREMGHTDADSLYQFVQYKRSADDESTLDASNIMSRNDVLSLPKSTTNVGRSPRDFDVTGYRMGPVLRLPAEPKVVMRISTPGPQGGGASGCNRHTKMPEKQIIEKINQACCLDAECGEKLRSLDTATNELRERATKLAKREAERVKLLERAEAAWRDLEFGYQGRINTAREKEEDLLRLTKTTIEDRNAYKNACLDLADQLKERGDAAELDRMKLELIEKQVCSKACEKANLQKLSAQQDGKVADQMCKSAQLDRDYQFKEEQARRKLQALESEVESMRALTHETERALRNELTALRDQIDTVSKDLLTQEEENNTLKTQIEEFAKEKAEIVEDLDGCKNMCDKRMQAMADDLKNKQERLNQLKAKVLDCRCKVPTDATVQVQRTISLAALCKCAPEDRLVEKCSCTSIRSRLLSAMLSDLFSGLQSEMGSVATDMSCQLLKCLEDKHNWDRASTVKAHLRNFFSRLLVNELDIAIATSIEKYHAKWVTPTCADLAVMRPVPGESDPYRWEERAIQRKAEEMATKIAEKMFETKAQELAQKAIAIASTKPVPCKCGETPSDGTPSDRKDKGAATYMCAVEPRWGNQAQSSQAQSPQSPQTSSGSGTQWRRTSRDIMLLRAELRNLKREMQNNQNFKEVSDPGIFKMANRATEFSEDRVTKDTDRSLHIKDTRKSQEQRGPKQMKRVKKNSFDAIKNFSKNANKIPVIHCGKNYKKQSFAVNMCLCSIGDQSTVKLQDSETEKAALNAVEESLGLMIRGSNDHTPQLSSTEQTKITLISPNTNNDTSTSCNITVSCHKDGACFHKEPSNKSIDELLKTLVKWNTDLESSSVVIPLKSDAPKLTCQISTITHANIDTTSCYLPAPSLSLNTNACLNNHISPINSNKYVGDSQREQASNKSTVSKNISSQRVDDRMLPISTPSEYMGAINLDKSNENFCKCVIGKVTEVSPGYQHLCKCPLQTIGVFNMNSENPRNPKNAYQTEMGKINRISKSPISINGSPISNKYEQQSPIISPVIRNYTPEIGRIHKTGKSPNSTKGRANTSNERKSLSSTSPVGSNEVDTAKMGTSVMKHTKGQNTDPTPNLNQIDQEYHDCDYRIEFLGVTLTDTDVQDKIGNATKGKIITKGYTKVERPVPDIRVTGTNYTDINDTRNNNVDLRNKKPEKLHTFKNDVVIDKAISANSAVGKDTCVCCVSQEDTEELERNAFYLLETHLRETLGDLKTGCRSSCLDEADKNKLFASLTEKIKHVISEGTMKVKCKCSEELHLEGSWNRAVTLLQEYLKIKINRVKCSCDSPTEHETILSELTTKVYDLIQSDIQRLKEICKCKNLGQPPQLNFLPDISKTNYTESKLDRNVETSNDKCGVISIDKSGQITNATVNFVQTSFHTKAYDNVQSKSCAVIDKDNKGVETGTPNNLVCYDQIVSLYKTMLDNTETVNHSDDFINSNRPEEQLKEKSVLCELSKPENKLHNKEVLYPYIGYTVNCSCDHKLPSCICSKSNVIENNLKISSLWDTLTTPNMKNKLTYIMDKVNKNEVEQQTINSALNLKQETDTSEQTLCDETDIEDNKSCSSKNCNSSKNIIILNKDIRCEAQLNNTGSQINESTSLVAQKHVHFPKATHMKQVKSESFATTKDVPIASDQECVCETVPMCHVKLLMENIEAKLANSECICDSMSSKVCPIHSH